MNSRGLSSAERRARFKKRVMYWAARLRVEPSQIRIQEMRRKWASCSTLGWVTFAADLIDQRRGFQDYVIVHELLHLRLSNHKRLFRALLSAHVPAWRRYAGTRFEARKERSL